MKKILNYLSVTLAIIGHPDNGVSQTTSACVAARAGNPILWTSEWHLLSQNVDVITCKLGGAWTTWGISFRNRNPEAVQVYYSQTIPDDDKSSKRLTIPAMGIVNDVASGEPDIELIRIEFKNAGAPGSNRCYNNSFGGSCDAKDNSTSPTIAQGPEERPTNNKPTPSSSSERREPYATINSRRSKTNEEILQDNLRQIDERAARRQAEDQRETARKNEREERRFQQQLADDAEFRKIERESKARYEARMHDAAAGLPVEPYYRLRYLLENHRIDEAVLVADSLVDVGPDFHVRLMLDEIYLAAGDTARLIEIYEQLSQSSDARVELKSLASLYVFTGQLARARKLYRTIEEVESGYGYPFPEDGEGVLLQLTNDKKVADWYKVQLGRVPSHALGNYNYGAFLIRKGKRKEGLRLIDKAAQSKEAGRIKEFADSAHKKHAVPLLLPSLTSDEYSVVNFDRHKYPPPSKQSGGASASANVGATLDAGLRRLENGNIRPVRGYMWVRPDEPQDRTVRLRDHVVLVNGTPQPAEGYHWRHPEDENDGRVLEAGLVADSDDKLHREKGYEWTNPNDPHDYRVQRTSTDTAVAQTEAADISSLTIQRVSAETANCKSGGWSCYTTVRIRDASGQPVPNIKVAWEVPAQGSHTYVNETDENGLASATNVYTSSSGSTMLQTATIVGAATGSGHHDYKPYQTSSKSVVFQLLFVDKP